MKTKLLIIFFMLNTSFVFSQETTKWEFLSKGGHFEIDSISEDKSYKFLSIYPGSHLPFISIEDTSSSLFFEGSLIQIDSSKFLRVAIEEKRKYPKSFLKKEASNTGDSFYFNFQISEDRTKTWKTIYRMGMNQDENPFKCKIIDFSGCHLYYLNDSTVLIYGNIEAFFPDLANLNRLYIIKLKHNENPDSLWNAEVVHLWDESLTSFKNLLMISNSIGYAILNNQIIKTNDCWKTYTILYSEKFIYPALDNLQVFKGTDSNFVACILPKNDKITPKDNMIIISHNEFKTVQKIDFNKVTEIRQIHLIGNDIYALVFSAPDTVIKPIKYYYQFIKTSNDGNSWKTLYQTNKFEFINNFKMLDSNNWLMSGRFFPRDSLLFATFIKTSDYGNNWEYIFEPNVFKDFIYEHSIDSYYYLNKDQIIITGIDNIFDIPLITDDSTFLYQLICKNLDPASKIIYLQTTKESTLIPPSLKIGSPEINIYSAPLDTLIWNKVEGADEYVISYYGINVQFEDFIFNFSVNNPGILHTAKKDTVIKDTFLIINDLIRNYYYHFRVYAQNQTQKSETSVLQSHSRIESILLPPKVIYPLNQTTIPSGSVEFSWEKVSGANDFCFTLIDMSNYVVPYIFIQEHYKGNSFRFDSLKPNSIYKFSICSSNNLELSNAIISGFYTSNDVSVSETEYISSKVYPNPTTDYITLNVPPLEKRGPGGVPQEIKIFDIFGNNVLSVETGLRPVSTRIDISTLPAGVYFVRIGEKVEKFVKL